MIEDEIIQEIQKWIINMRQGTRVNIIHKGDVDFCNYLDNLLELYYKEKEENRKLRNCHLRYEEITGIDLLLEGTDE